ncbi:hypothetical protein DAI22_03g299100 [Oryza sativa Japonica Group]|nr:hypothetical protein DAI22_03g299100 [Oryza sativa Japonica Group]
MLCIRVYGMGEVYIRTMGESTVGACWSLSPTSNNLNSHVSLLSVVLVSLENHQRAARRENTWMHSCCWRRKTIVTPCWAISGC